VNRSVKTSIANAVAIVLLSATVPVFLAQSATATGCTGTQVSAGSDLQSAIDSQDHNTTFCLAAGTYDTSTTIRPKSGDSFVGTGATRDSVTVQTSSAQIIFAAAPNNLFRHLAIAGAVNACPGSNCGATGMGINGGSGITVDDVHLYDNGRAGIGGSGDALVVSNSEVDHNGAVTGDGVSSGIKSVHTLTVRDSYVHDNINSGIWCDISCGAYTVTGNTVTDQRGTGIFMEISQGDAVLANNVVRDNNTFDARGRGGILITSSKNVQVYGNSLGGNRGFGMGARADRRAGNCGTPDENCGYALANVSMHDNNLGGDSVRGCALSGVTCKIAGLSIDPNDTAGGLDITALRATGSRGGSGHFKVETQGGFTCRKLRVGKSNRLKLLFDDQRDGTVDLVGKFYCAKGTDSRNHWFVRIRGTSSGSHYGALRATRPNRRTVKVTIPLNLKEFTAAHMGVSARSKDATAPVCVPHACRDRASSLEVY
jgi:parallel beta-helix repeat protein